ncbi:MAG: hypothetical protein H0U75_12150 [Legionella sp.]|nr:hypothetical protein [Legionella sp.]
MRTKIILPLKDQILKAMEVGETSIEASEYLVEQFKKIVAKAKMTNKAGDMISRLEDYAEIVKLRLHDTGSAWTGEQPSESNFKNMQNNLATQAAEILIEQGLEEGLQLDIVIDDSSSLLRGYSHV